MGQISRSILLALLCVFNATTAMAQTRLNEQALQFGFTPVHLITKFNVKEFLLPTSDRQALIADFCKKIHHHYARYGWEEEPCGNLDWQVDLTSKHGSPLIYLTIGSGEHTTLILGGVHPDELTPIPISFRFARFMAQTMTDDEKKDIRVVIAPLVNPDGFLIDRPTRTNANGVDVNRNFFTLDWYDRAKLFWRSYRGRQARYFPGYFPNSEIETMFQIDMMEKFRPDKIVSLHAPLGFLDYDGPGSISSGKMTKSEEQARKLVQGISKKSKNYRVVNYAFYPGSLGNFAGNERNIPTITLELETTDPKKVEDYWQQFLPGLVYTVQYPFKNTPKPGITNASVFFDQYLNGSKTATEQNL